MSLSSWLISQGLSLDELVSERDLMSFRSRWLWVRISMGKSSIIVFKHYRNVPYCKMAQRHAHEVELRMDSRLTKPGLQCQPVLEPSLQLLSC